METLATIAVILLVGVTAFILGCIIGSRLEASRNRREIAKKYKLHKIEHVTASYIPFNHALTTFSEKVIQHLSSNDLFEFRTEDDRSYIKVTFLTKKK